MLKSCDGNKATWPDGFNLGFFKHLWPIVKGEVNHLFNDFHEFGKLVKGLSATFICLIPKYSCPETIADFRPISLIGSAYKLISKVLAARLQSIMPVAITENQFAFRLGR